MLLCVSLHPPSNACPYTRLYMRVLKHALKHALMRVLTHAFKCVNTCALTCVHTRALTCALICVHTCAFVHFVYALSAFETAPSKRRRALALQPPICVHMSGLICLICVLSQHSKQRHGSAGGRWPCPTLSTYVGIGQPRLRPGWRKGC